MNSKYFHIWFLSILEPPSNYMPDLMKNNASYFDEDFLKDIPTKANKKLS